MDTHYLFLISAVLVFWASVNQLRGARLGASTDIKVLRTNADTHRLNYERVLRDHERLAGLCSRQDQMIRDLQSTNKRLSGLIEKRSKKSRRTRST